MQRIGRRNRPFYRIAAIDRRERREGLVIEQLGWFNPLEKDAAKAVQLNAERIKYWLSKGAQPSETLHDMLAKAGLMDKGPWEAQRGHDRKKVAAKIAKAAAEGEKKEEKKA